MPPPWDVINTIVESERQAVNIYPLEEEFRGRVPNWHEGVLLANPYYYIKKQVKKSIYIGKISATFSGWHFRCKQVGFVWFCSVMLVKSACKSKVPDCNL